MAQLKFDDQARRELETLYRTADANRRRGLVRAALSAAAGESIADVGCGPGFLCAELAADVGPGGKVVGIDSSPTMLEVAADRCHDHPHVELRAGEATHLPLESESVDGAICVQVLEYVPDVATALRELHRILRPGGRIVIWDVDWATVSWHSADAERMRRVLKAWDEHLVHPSLPLTLAPAMRTAGFSDVEMHAHPFAAAGPFDTETYGAGISGLIARFAAGRAGVTDGDARAWEAEQHALGDRGEYAFACLQSCFTGFRP